MSGKDQQTAHDLAQLAARLGAGIQHDAIESFAVAYDLLMDEVRVSLRLTNGATEVYAVRREKERDTPAGESLPSSPTR